MRTDATIVIKAFHEDKNCAQSVLLGFADRFQIQEDHALSIAAGFGAGMGRLQRTCGVVSGSYMVIGLYSGTKSIYNAERKEIAYSMIRDFTKRFEDVHGTSACADLLHCDLNTIEGQAKFESSHLKENVCEKCIQHSLDILDDLMEEYN
jgi:C_GCAxxG_C_C family probable redox protein